MIKIIRTQNEGSLEYWTSIIDNPNNKSTVRYLNDVVDSMAEGTYFLIHNELYHEWITIAVALGRQDAICAVLTMFDIPEQGLTLRERLALLELLY